MKAKKIKKAGNTEDRLFNIARTKHVLVNCQATIKANTATSAAGKSFSKKYGKQARLLVG